MATEKFSIDSSFDAEFLAELKDFEAKLADIDFERAALNSKKKDLTTSLINRGMNKEAIMAAIRYYRTVEEKREAFDLSYAIMRKALGVPIQDDLFVAFMQHSVDKHINAKTN